MSDKPEPGLGVLRKANCLCYTMREPVQLCAHRSSTRITKHLQQVVYLRPAQPLDCHMCVERFRCH